MLLFSTNPSSFAVDSILYHFSTLLCFINFPLSKRRFVLGKIFSHLKNYASLDSNFTSNHFDISMLPFIVKSQNVVHIVYIFFSHIFLKIHFNEDFTHFYFTKSVCTVTDGLPVDKSKGQSSVLTFI